MTELDRTVVPRSSTGQKAALALVQTNEGLGLMEKVRGVDPSGLDLGDLSVPRRVASRDHSGIS